ncbi:hypothetical protein [Clostridium beijerinckii]|uniref:Uncharacterized protein n=1 Tax=Clostridium beijerinckii TaxID=1520 RepID=A0AAW3WDV8_CLOBE|nr:hypothetical protein [Clostridium beijerinckii]MBC2459607.1 hypothetical protein [Clostridium beijerinckii]MBC2477120.1 hypothetical protein [Clostridium beijerinckii]NOV61066.1 hypothetical protein [Clostridium beijerinckii]NOV69441.1 hypothetical protein [Clostridium beijerinckii]NOW33071.1 hypothetical protein [Clostridium beijerinckii]
MSKRKQNELQKNDFAPDENEEIIGFTPEPVISGKCISSFSFDDDEDEINTAMSNNSSNNNNNNNNNNCSYNSNNGSSIESNNPALIISFDDEAASTQNVKASNSNILADNRKVSLANGMAPPIDGEFLDTKRTYMLRSSTVRKVNELKSRHPDLNTYVSTIVDMAIAHYYNYIVNECEKKE